MRGGRLHSGAAPGQIDHGTGGSFFFGARGGRGRVAVPPPLPQGAPRATVRWGGGAAEDSGLRRDRGQERTMSGKGSERGILVVIKFHNRIVSLLQFPNQMNSTLLVGDLPPRVGDLPLVFSLY